VHQSQQGHFPVLQRFYPAMRSVEDMFVPAHNTQCLNERRPGRTWDCPERWACIDLQYRRQKSLEVGAECCFGSRNSRSGAQFPLNICCTDGMDIGRELRTVPLVSCQLVPW
jgi:hypothetical protein